MKLWIKKVKVDLLTFKVQSWTKVVVTPTPSPRIQCCHMKSQFNIDLGGGVLQHFCPRLSDIRFP